MQGVLDTETQYFFSIVSGGQVTHHNKESRSAVSVIPCCFNTTPNFWCSVAGRDSLAEVIDGVIKKGGAP